VVTEGGVGGGLLTEDDINGQLDQLAEEKFLLVLAPSGSDDQLVPSFRRQDSVEDQRKGDGGRGLPDQCFKQGTVHRTASGNQREKAM
jgi:hypothetical protein